ALPISDIMFSDIEAASPHKLPEYGIVGHFLAGDGHKIIKELHKTFGLHIFRLVFADTEKKRFRIELEAGKLIDKSGVEHHVRLLLERKDILLLEIGRASCRERV